MPFRLASGVGRLARLASLASLGAPLWLCSSHVQCLHFTLHDGGKGGAPREARFVRLAQRTALMVEFTCQDRVKCLHVAIQLSSGVGRLARLASLASLGAPL